MLCYDGLADRHDMEIEIRVRSLAEPLRDAANTDGFILTFAAASPEVCCPIEKKRTSYSIGLITIHVLRVMVQE